MCQWGGARYRNGGRRLGRMAGGKSLAIWRALLKFMLVGGFVRAGFSRWCSSGRARRGFGCGLGGWFIDFGWMLAVPHGMRMRLPGGRLRGLRSLGSPGCVLLRVVLRWGGQVDKGGAAGLGLASV